MIRAWKTRSSLVSNGSFGLPNASNSESAIFNWKYFKPEICIIGYNILLFALPTSQTPPKASPISTTSTIQLSDESSVLNLNFSMSPPWISEQSDRGRLDHHLSQMAASVCRMLQTQSQPSLIGNSLNLRSVSLAITFYASHFQRAKRYRKHLQSQLHQRFNSRTKAQS